MSAQSAIYHPGSIFAEAIERSKTNEAASKGT